MTSQCSFIALFSSRRAAFSRFCDLARAHSSAADFVTIYIKEAHAADEYFFGDNYVSVNQAKNLNERKEVGGFTML